MHARLWSGYSWPVLSQSLFCTVRFLHGHLCLPSSPTPPTPRPPLSLPSPSPHSPLPSVPLWSSCTGTVLIEKACVSRLSLSFHPSHSTLSPSHSHSPHL